MLEFQVKKRVKKILYSRAMFVVILAAIVLAGRATWSVYQKEKISQLNLHRLQGEIAELKQKEDYIKSGINRLGTARGIEEEIRQKFKVVKGGEAMAILIDDETAITATSTEKGFWSTIVDVFR
jgi:cell division protein FtsB